MMALLIDAGELYTLRAVLVHPAARELARRFGPGIFTGGPIRTLAAAIVCDKWNKVRALSATEPGAEPTEMDELCALVLRCTCPTDDDSETGEPWGVRLVALLADRARDHLVVEVLDWARRRIEEDGWAARDVRDEVFAVFGESGTESYT